jgi:uncharacterized protein YjaG (DUF416 family)
VSYIWGINNENKNTETMMSPEEFKKNRVRLLNTFVFDTDKEYSAFCAATRFAQCHIYNNIVNKALEDLHEQLQNVKEFDNGTLSITVSESITQYCNFALSDLGRSSMVSEEMSYAIRKQFVKK